jgi:hypothetical protein
MILHHWRGMNGSAGLFPLKSPKQEDVISSGYARSLSKENVGPVAGPAALTVVNDGRVAIPNLFGIEPKRSQTKFGSATPTPGGMLSLPQAG